MKTIPGRAFLPSSPFPLIAACFWLLGGPVSSAPIFTAGLNNSSLVARLDWSSDLGVDLVNDAGAFAANGSPQTVSASAFRDGRTISASITQTAPYVLNNQYWAADWTGLLNIPAGGFYGLGATASASGNWSFSVSPATTMYYAAIWSINAPAAIHPGFDVASVHPVAPQAGGSALGSFKQQDWFSFGIPGFPSRPTFIAETWSLDQNPPGSMLFSYRIAFSTTPIGADVFDPPAGNVPEPTTYLLSAAGLAVLAVLRGRR
jgi:hypothetical protein